jgi:AGZA family xanthine/uracil permease-like MFS transporter
MTYRPTMLEKLFKLQANNTTVKQEFLGGLTTFFTMAYIVVVAPMILSNAGIPHESAFVATCLVVAIATIISGLYSNYPIAFAPGLGLLSYFAFVVAKQHGYTWQAGLGVVMCAGLIFFVITITPIRRHIIACIPKSLGSAIAAGIGIFIGFIALKNVGFIVGNHNTLVGLGQVDTAKMLLFLFGFCLIMLLAERKVPGALLIGIVVLTAIGMLFHITPYKGIFAWPDFHVKTFMALNWHAGLHGFALPIVFTFVMVALFDSTGSLIGITHHLPEEHPGDRSKRLNRALIAESIGTVIGAAMGTTTLSPFVENASGIRAGARTGLAAMFIALFFLLTLCLWPFATSVPTYATSAALLYVACLMLRPLATIEWDNFAEYVPAMLTMILIPLTFSIADGVGFGVLAYVVFNAANRDFKKIHPMLWVLAALFVVYFVV